MGRFPMIVAICLAMATEFVAAGSNAETVRFGEDLISALYHAKRATQPQESNDEGLGLGEALSRFNAASQELGSAQKMMGSHLQSSDLRIRESAQEFHGALGKLSTYYKDGQAIFSKVASAQEAQNLEELTVLMTEASLWKSMGTDLWNGALEAANLCAHSLILEDPIHVGVLALTEKERRGLLSKMDKMIPEAGPARDDVRRRSVLAAITLRQMLTDLTPQPK